MIGDILQPTHLLFILVIALLVLGPKRLPEVGRSLGRGLRDFKSALNFDDQDHHEEVLTPAAAPPTGAAQAPAPPATTAQAPAVPGAETQTPAPPVPETQAPAPPAAATVPAAPESPAPAHEPAQHAG